MAQNTEYTLVDTGREEDRPHRETVTTTSVPPKTERDLDVNLSPMPTVDTGLKQPTTTATTTDASAMPTMAPKKWTDETERMQDGGGIRNLRPEDTIGQPTESLTGVAPKPTVPTPESTTGGTTSGSGYTSTSSVDPRAKQVVNQILDDPTKYLTDNKLLQSYTQQQVQQDELMDPNKYQVGGQAPLPTKEVEILQGTAAEDVKVKDFSASLIDPGSLTKAVDEIGKLEPMKAASMAEHLDGLLKDLESGNVPLWARPAVTQVEQMLAARGISASSVGRDSLFNAIIQAAMPIAQQDATFEQESYKTNYNAKIQAVLSDVNMEFAAKQFNANSENQINQFKAQMETQVAMQNASRKDAMMQFNVSNAMQAQQFNASQVNAMTQLQTQLQAQREQFNVQMASQIEQSNVNWRRQVNTANTAGINAVNQANVQNAFNLNNQALTFLWQEMRDKAHWEFQASESEKDRRNQLEAALLASEAAMGGEIGKYIEGIVQGSKFLSSFLDSWK